MSLRASQLLPMSSVPQLQDACLQIGLQKLNGQCQDVPNDENWHQPPDAYHPLFTLRQSNMAGKSPRRILCIHTHDLSRDFKHFPHCLQLDDPQLTTESRILLVVEVTVQH